MLISPEGLVKGAEDGDSDVLGRFRALLLLLLPNGMAADDAVAAALGLVAGDHGRLGFNSVCSCAGCSNFPAVIFGFERCPKTHRVRR